MEPLIRDATLDDVPFLTEVVLLASRSHVKIGVWDLAVPDDDALRRRCIAAVLTSDQRSWCHYRNFIIAEVDGVPAAGLSAFAAYDETLLPIGKALVASFVAIGFEGDEIGEAIRRVLIFETCHLDDLKGAWIIEWVATLADFRGQGVVRELLHAILARGKERGHLLAQIGILKGNDAAQRAYESVGFEVEAERTSEEFEAIIGSPGLRRFSRDYN